MQKKLLLLILANGLVGSIFGTDLQEEIAKDMTAMMRSYHQALTVNEDATFNQAEYFVDFDKSVSTISKHMRIFYKLNIGKKYPNSHEGDAGEYRKMLEDSAKKVLAECVEGKYDFKWEGANAYIKKWDGLMLPARFVQLTMKEFNRRVGNKINLKFTTSKRLLVNEEHAPDAWESEVIEKYLLSKNKVTAMPHGEYVGEKYRYILPEIFDTACVSCHGTGANQEGTLIHASSYPRKLGDFGGAISVIVEKSLQ